MKTNWKALMIGGALLAGLSGTAAARDNVSFSLSFGAPGPVYVAPPAPVYYYGPRYYAPPPAVYYSPPAPVYYTQPAFGFTIGHGHHRHWHGHHHHRHHHHRHHHHRHWR
jgi:hypothetical protein